MADFDALARPIQYRLSPAEAVPLNTVVDLVGGMRRGVLLEEFDFSDVPGVGYTEKRAQDDGLDVSDVYLGPRLIRLVGTVYGIGPADLQDRVQVVRTALTPTVAYNLDKPNFGYLPLEFELPTNDVEYPTGYRPLEFRARPRSQPRFSLRRDAGGGRGLDNSRGAGIQFASVLECRDPRMYVRPQVVVYHELPNNVDRPLVNRGDYPAPIEIRLHIPADAATSDDAYVDFIGAGAHIRLRVPESSSPQYLRYYGALKIAMMEVDDVETLRMDLLRYVNNSDHPLVAPGGSTMRWVVHDITALGAGSRIEYSESYA